MDEYDLTTLNTVDINITSKSTTSILVLVKHVMKCFKSVVEEKDFSQMLDNIEDKLETVVQAFPESAEAQYITKHKEQWIRNNKIFELKNRFEKVLEAPDVDFDKLQYVVEVMETGKDFVWENLTDDVM